MANYDGLTRNTWTGTWSPTSDHPIVLDTEIRGSLRYISGGVGDRLTDISGQRLQEGMLVYVKNSYVNGSGDTVQGDEYYTYSLGQGESRDPGTGQMPNADTNWTQAQLGSTDPGTLTLTTRDSTEEITLNVNNSFNLSLRSGIGTVQSSPGTPQVSVGGTGSVVGIDTIGTSTFNQLNATNLNLSGIATFLGLGNFRSNLYLGNDDGSGNRSLIIGDNQYFTLKSLSGLDSIIEHGSTSNGDLYLLSGRSVFLRTSSGEASAYFRSGGAVELYHNNFKKFETTATGVDVYGGANISGIVTVGSGTSDRGVESPGYKLSNNNQTLIGTGGTTGDIKMILGAPFFHDGTAWREFYLKEGIPVTQSADTEWDNVILRTTFDSDTTDVKFDKISLEVGSPEIVASPRKIGSGSLRIPPSSYVEYSYRPEYVFTGDWTIEGWFYFDSFPGISGYHNLVCNYASSVNFSNFWSFGFIYDSNSSQITFFWENNAGSNTGAISLGVYGISSNNLFQNWVHLTLVRESSDGSIHFYLNGAESPSTSSNQIIDNNIINDNSYDIHLGTASLGSPELSRNFDGFIDDLRISTVARYTSDFTPPTEALPVTGTLTGPFEPAYFGEISNLGDLYDVSSGTPTTGQVLKWNGTEWAPASDLTADGGTGIGLTDLSVTTSPAGPNSLLYDNTTGTFTFVPTSLVGYATETYVDNAVAGMATVTYVDNAIVGFITSGGSGSGLTGLTGASAGTYGDFDKSARITVDSNGRITSITEVGITTDGAGIDVVGISTFNDNVSFASTILVEGAVNLTTNNATIVGTSGTIGDIKMIGGSPFFYDGGAWREFSLTSGTPVTTPEDTEWDNVIVRSTFDSDISDIKFNATILEVGSPEIVASPTKVGTGALRIPNNSYVEYNYRSEYVFTGEWTIEGWFYFDSFPTQYNNLVCNYRSSSDSAYFWTFGFIYDSNSSQITFFWENNASDSSGLGGQSLGTYQISPNNLFQNWVHLALVREPLDGSIHFYFNGTESPSTSSNQIKDNNIINDNSYDIHLGTVSLGSPETSRTFDGFIDDLRISTVARYTSDFTAPTTALPTSGDLSVETFVPDDKYGEIGLGTSPTWRGTSGVTVSQQTSGNYRLTFTSSYTNKDDYYVISQGMDQGFASYVGIARSTTHVDISINKQSDDTAVDIGALSVQIRNHI